MSHRAFDLRTLAIPALIVLGLGLACLASTARAADPVWSHEQELSDIQRMIEQQGLDWVASSNEVSVLTPEEKQRMLGFVPPTPEYSAKVPVFFEDLPARDLPTRWDWREHNGMTSAKNQGNCGSCWAFAAVGVLEAYHKIETGTQVLFSEQQCLVCNEGGGTCAGGFTGYCYDLWTQFGAVLSSNMPYNGNDGAPCVQDGFDVRARIEGQYHVNSTETALKTAVLEHPIAAPIYAGDNMFYYGGGCYSGAAGSTNHVVVLCGWDDNACSGQGAWLIKNSWGQSWGGSELGFGWIKYGTCSINSGGDDGIIYEPFPNAKVAYADHAILGDNGNGCLDPGETAQIAVTARNYGISTASAITGTLTALTSGVTVTDDDASFANMASWASATSSAPHFTVQIAPSVAAGTLLEFRLVMTTSASCDTSYFADFAAPVTVIYENDFESGSTGWTHGGRNDDWRCATAAGYSGHPDPKIAATGTKLMGTDLNEAGAYDGLYENTSATWTTSPTIDCSAAGGVHLVFNRWLTVEQGIYDDAIIEVNGIEVWRNQEHGNHCDKIWTPVSIDISDIADGVSNVAITFRLTSDAGLRFGGWNIDDLRVVATGSYGQPVEHAAAAPQFLSVSTHPNPFAPLTKILLAIPVSTDNASVQIFDAMGRRVRTLHEGPLTEGAHFLTWTGTDDEGRALPAGTYFCRAQAAGATNVTKIIRID